MRVRTPALASLVADRARVGGREFVNRGAGSRCGDAARWPDSSAVSAPTPTEFPSRADRIGLLDYRWSPSRPATVGSRPLTGPHVRSAPPPAKPPL